MCVFVYICTCICVCIHVVLLHHCYYYRCFQAERKEAHLQNMQAILMEAVLNKPNGAFSVTTTTTTTFTTTLTYYYLLLLLRRVHTCTKTRIQVALKSTHTLPTCTLRRDVVHAIYGYMYTQIFGAARRSPRRIWVYVHESLGRA